MPCQARDRSEQELGYGERRPQERRQLVFDVAADEDRRSVVERMRERSRRLDQVELEVERPEERRCGDQGVDRRADVVPEAGERELRGARPAADRVARLEDADRVPGLGEGDRGSEAVRARADDYGV